MKLASQEFWSIAHFSPSFAGGQKPVPTEAVHRVPIGGGEHRKWAQRGRRGRTSGVADLDQEDGQLSAPRRCPYKVSIQ